MVFVGFRRTVHVLPPSVDVIGLFVEWLVWSVSANLGCAKDNSMVVFDQVLAGVGPLARKWHSVWRYQLKAKPPESGGSVIVSGKHITTYSS